ncbi:MAG: PPOX class F420-dependent oxidoreductase [Anaerolineaceae bacterium]|nr:PPOX class F420-dependent oxidoreductase [Anaerolineaceae bacterium]
MTNQFDHHKYINIETYRQNGQGVKTPVWFVQKNEGLYVWTEESSYKVKRILKNRKGMVVPSKYNGEPIGEWVEMYATVDGSLEAQKKVSNSMLKKYGLAMRVFRFMGKLRKASYTTLLIKLNDSITE